MSTMSASAAATGAATSDCLSIVYPCTVAAVTSDCLLMVYPSTAPAAVAAADAAAAAEPRRLPSCPSSRSLPWTGFLDGRSAVGSAAAGWPRGVELATADHTDATAAVGIRLRGAELAAIGQSDATAAVGIWSRGTKLGTTDHLYATAAVNDWFGVAELAAVDQSEDTDA